MPEPLPIAVLGAGIAGLAASQHLARAGHRVLLFDKGRRPGGRVATRRFEGQSFNHGAQFATARAPDFAAVLADLVQAGSAALWPAADHPGRAEHAHVGQPGMNAIPAALARQAEAAGVVPHMSRHVAWLHRAADGWHLRHAEADTMRPGATDLDAGEAAGPFAAVLLALPAPQAAALLRTAAHPFAAHAAAAELAPCWAVLARFATPIPGPDIRRHHGPIAWAARETARPGAPPGEDAWTLHADAAWSTTHLEARPEDAARLLLEAFGHGPATHAMAHRWRHALVTRAAGTPCLWDPALRLGAAGDWCLGPRVEAAWDSGAALARAVLAGA